MESNGMDWNGIEWNGIVIIYNQSMHMEVQTLVVIMGSDTIDPTCAVN